MTIVFCRAAPVCQVLERKARFQKRSTLAATSAACCLARCMRSTKRHSSPQPTARSKAFGRPLAGKIAAIAGGSFKHRDPPDIRGTGYVVDALETALWAFHRSRDFREGALLPVNLGDDADTIGAIYVQIAGAHYEADAIPAEWRERLTMNNEIASMADSLYAHARQSLAE